MDTSQQHVSLAGLSSRAQAVVHRALAGRAVTPNNLQSLTQRDLFMLVGVGPRTLKEIVSWAEAKSLRLARGA